MLWDINLYIDVLYIHKHNQNGTPKPAHDLCAFVCEEEIWKTFVIWLIMKAVASQSAQIVLRYRGVLWHTQSCPKDKRCQFIPILGSIYS